MTDCPSRRVKYLVEFGSAEDAIRECARYSNGPKTSRCLEYIADTCAIDLESVKARRNEMRSERGNR